MTDLDLGPQWALNTFERAQNLHERFQERGRAIGDLPPTKMPLREDSFIGIHCPKTVMAQARLILHVSGDMCMVGLHSVSTLTEDEGLPGDPVDLRGLTTGGRWRPVRSPDPLERLYVKASLDYTLELWGEATGAQPVRLPVDEETLGIFAGQCLNALSRRVEPLTPTV